MLEMLRDSCSPTLTSGPMSGPPLQMRHSSSSPTPTSVAGLSSILLLKLTNLKRLSFSARPHLPPCLHEGLRILEDVTTFSKTKLILSPFLTPIKLSVTPTYSWRRRRRRRIYSYSMIL